jgi:hypothetical protein
MIKFAELFQKQEQLAKEMNERFNKTSGTFLPFKTSPSDVHLLRSKILSERKKQARRNAGLTETNEDYKTEQKMPGLEYVSQPVIQKE